METVTKLGGTFGRTLAIRQCKALYSHGCAAISSVEVTEEQTCRNEQSAFRSSRRNWHISTVFHLFTATVSRIRHSVINKAKKTISAPCEASVHL